jgi:DNA-binding MarR family transcriptional regulator
VAAGSRKTEAKAAGNAVRAAENAPALTRVELDFLPLTIGYFLRRLQDAYKRYFVTQGAAFDMTPKDVAALVIISANKGISPTQLGAAMAIDAAMTSLMLAALERRGFVKRSKSPSDGRARVVSLTKSGAATVAELRDAVPSIDRHFTDALTESERSQLLGMLARLWASRSGEVV